MRTVAARSCFGVCSVGDHDGSWGRVHVMLQPSVGPSARLRAIPPMHGTLGFLFAVDAAVSRVQRTEQRRRSRMLIRVCPRQGAYYWSGIEMRSPPMTSFILWSRLGLSGCAL